MNINKLIKKQAFLSLISLALIAFIVTGSSYALFQSSVVDSNIHSVTTPNFVISYLNSSGQALSNSNAPLLPSAMLSTKLTLIKLTAP